MQAACPTLEWGSLEHKWGQEIWILNHLRQVFCISLWNTGPRAGTNTAILAVKILRPRVYGKCFPGVLTAENTCDYGLSCLWVVRWGRQTVPCPHGPGAVTQRDDFWRARPAAARVFPPAVQEEAHPFVQQVFLILPQMGNSFHRILMHETRMFSVMSYIPLFIPSVNNYLLSSLDVLH